MGPNPSEGVLFRPSKRRKAYRQRAADDEDEHTIPSPTNVAPHPPTTPNPQSLDDLISSASGARTNDNVKEVESVSVSMAEILRLRKMKKRPGGVEFRSDTHSQTPKDPSQALVLHTEDAEDSGGIVGNGVPRKFAPQTGTVGDVNTHMMAYIDSEMAKRRALEGSKNTDASTSLTGSGTLSTTFKNATKEAADTNRQPATLGKLQEVDLGDDVRSRNVELTDRARRIAGGENVLPGGSVKAKPVKVRLGPDGKPWRSRTRRASEDIARDKIVEAVLRENRLDIYEEPVPEKPTTGNDGAADDRIAEEFRREFMDAVSQRQRKKPGPPQPAARTAAGKKEEEVMKGPKLGGSRTARAAMRESMLKAAKK